MHNSRFKFRAWQKASKFMSYPKERWDVFPSSVVSNDKTSLSFDCWEIMQSTSLRDKSNYCKLVYEYDIINIDGYIIGNYYENEDLLKEKTNLLIKRFGEKNWYATYKEAMDRGCKYS